MSLTPERRHILKILPPELIEALRQPLSPAARRELIHTMISNELVRIQALRYTEELRLARQDNEPVAHPSDPSDRVE